MKNLLPIGRFSKVSRLTIKTLRHYDEYGLLRPALVDPESGYRYYSVAQLGEAERIRLLRSLDMPLDEIKAILDERDEGAVRARLERHRERIEAQVAEFRRGLDILQNLLRQETRMSYEVKIRNQTAQPYLSIRARTALAQIGPLFGKSLGELFPYIAGLGVRPAGPPFAIYHDPEFKEEDIDVEICVPCERPLTGKAHMNAGSLSEGPVAYTLHSGAYRNIGPAYQAVAAWINEHGHETSGPPREVYLVGVGTAKEESEYRTEIQWPLQQGAPKTS